MADTSPDPGPPALDKSRIAAYLRDHLPSAGFSARVVAGGMTLVPCQGGHSNLTYIVSFGDLELVLRRPPFGPVPPRAHDMAREHRWLTVLHDVYPLAPRPYLLCEDVSVAGAPFSVMERRGGLVLREEEPAALVDRPDQRARISRSVVDTLARLHAIDISEPTLAALGTPHGFLGRQVRGWTGRWHASRTAIVPEMETVAQWLRDHLPAETSTPSIVHGDFKLDNVMLDEHDLGRVVAVLDWEMTALGDPLVDLGILLTYWGPTAPPGEQWQSAPFTMRDGWLSRDAIIDRYARQSGRSVANITFYEIFATFKVAVVIQQLFQRYVRGAMRDPRFARFDGRAAYLARRAAARIAGIRAR